jgi:hypothetical protein
MAYRINQMSVLESKKVVLKVGIFRNPDLALYIPCQTDLRYNTVRGVSELSIGAPPGGPFVGRAGTDLPNRTARDRHDLDGCHGI